MSQSKDYTVTEVTHIVQGRSKANNLIGVNTDHSGAYMGPTKVVDPRFLIFSLNGQDPTDYGAFERGSMAGISNDQTASVLHGLKKMNYYFLRLT